MKKIIALLLAICMLAFTGCLFEDSHSTISNRNQVEKQVEDFFFLVGNDLEAAKRLLHPNFYAENGGFEAFIEDFKQEYTVDICDGVSIISKMGSSFGSGYYPAQNYSYKHYRFSYLLVVGLKEMHIFIEVREDQYGYGIYTFEKYSGQLDK